MAMQDYFLVFDAGTQSVKVAVYDEQLQCVAKASHQTTLSYPEIGWVQMDADEYLSLVKQGILNCVEQLKQKNIQPEAVKMIMGDGIICGIVGINQTGKAITPYINYLDSRTKADADSLNGQNYAIWQQETGNPEPLCMFPAMHARWLLSNNTAFKQSGVKFVHNAPYILMNLAGLSAEDAFIDWGTMSGWGLGYKVYKKEWSSEQLAILGIKESYMPRIVKPWDIIGKLSAECAQDTGLLEGTPICAGAGDTMQSMLGCGIYEANRAVDVAGTCAMFCVSTKGIVPELSKPGSGLIFNSGTLENTYFYWGFVRTGGLALRWFKDNICDKSADDSYYQKLSKRAKEVKPGCDEVTFLPYLTGGHSEYASVKGAFLNLTMATDQATLWRAVLEAIAYDYKDVTDTYRQAGIEIKQITVTEGGSRDALWNQIKADVMAAEVVTYADSGGAVLMNALIAAYAAENINDLRAILEQKLAQLAIYKPDRQMTQLYKAQALLQKSLLARLQG